ncbi:hypothetical protein RDI58_011413 [Solanum bulbocastanum]|uniref:Uncharacterized protein n=1 Tax=Solanum bulbocastanum TaxID=147425 RepID=A0AAN8TV87_SOLBU
MSLSESCGITVDDNVDLNW